MAMDVKELRDSTLVSGISNGNTNFDQNNIPLQCSENKSYQDIRSNTLGKVEAHGSRPCAIIGPDRVQPPPLVGDAYHKKDSVEPWPYSDTVYQLPAEFPQKLTDYQSMTNISPRQTFQENMQRVMVPPSYHSTKSVEDNVLKSSKVDMPLEVKYCEVPYSINPTINSQKSIRNSDVPISSINSSYSRSLIHGWPSAVGARPPRPFASEFYQYPEAGTYSGPRPIQRIHLPSQEEPSQRHPEHMYAEGNVRFKPYPSAKERYPQHRYDYISNYSNTYHPQLPFPPQKYEVNKTIPSHPYPMYPHVPMRRIPDPILDPYQRPNQPNFNPYQNQYIPHSYGPVPGNCMPSKMYPYPPEISPNTLTATKLPYDVNSKLYVDYENVRNKMYSSVDNMTYFNDPKRQLALKNDITLTMHPGMNMHHIPQHHMYRKDNMPMKPMESIHQNPYASMQRHHLHFNPSLAKSPAESLLSNDAVQPIGMLQEDCGYVSQSSTASGRSIDSGNFRIHNENNRKNYNLYSAGPKLNQKNKSNSSSNCSNKKGLDVRQFLQMWNEGEDEVSDTTNTSLALTTQSDTVSNQEQLVILGSMTIPNEELSKYEHIQKISKLPENIKGYNSIELLDQYEQLVESPALRHNNKSMMREYHMSPKITKQSSLIPRPLSPLDVEAKISQSVIHKEVGCNFEIKPCSPKMMNVEVATPLQNIINERTIEKVINTSISTPPLLPNSRTDIVGLNSPTASCKMNSPYITNKDLIKNNDYSLQDLESNSGVCLASLPRLDSDIELNFPEINQQFIDANRFKVCTSNEESKAMVAQSWCKSDSNCDKDLLNQRSVKTPELSSIETAKLSKYRKTKTCDSLPNIFSNRTDSVIIKNPDTNRKIEACDVTNALQENSENIRDKDIKCHVQDIEIKDMSCTAIDFSVNKINHGTDVSHDTENFLFNPGKKSSPERHSYDETQTYALSLVTKKVEMELSDLEQNKYSPKSDLKQNEPGFSLGLICVDSPIPDYDSSFKINETPPNIAPDLDENKNNLTEIGKIMVCNTNLVDELPFKVDKDDGIISDLSGHIFNTNVITDDEKNNLDINKSVKYLHNTIFNEIDTNNEKELNENLIKDTHKGTGTHENHNTEKEVETVTDIKNSVYEGQLESKNNSANIANEELIVQQNTAENKAQVSGDSVDKGDIKFDGKEYDNIYSDTVINVQAKLNNNTEEPENDIKVSEYNNSYINSEKGSSDFDKEDTKLDITEICTEIGITENITAKKNVCESDSDNVVNCKNIKSNDIESNETTSNFSLAENSSNVVKNKHKLLADSNKVINQELSEIKKSIISELQLSIGSQVSDTQKETLSEINFDTSITKLNIQNDDTSISRVSDNDDINVIASDNSFNNSQVVSCRKEIHSEIPLCLDDNSLSNSEETKTTSFVKTFCDRNQCFKKEYFSPWMQKLFIFSSGLCIEPFQENNIKNSKSFNVSKGADTTINNFKSGSESNNENNCEDVIFSTILESPSTVVSEKIGNENQVISEECAVVTQEVFKEANNRANSISSEEDDIVNKKPIKKLSSNFLFPKRVNLKRSLSDSAIDLYNDDNFDNNKSLSNKRRKIVENFIEPHVNGHDIFDVIQNNRRKSISAICNNDNVLILIDDDNEYIMTEEDGASRNMEFLEEPSEFLHCMPDDNALNVYIDTEIHDNTQIENNEENVSCPSPLEDEITKEHWLSTHGDMDTIFNDDVAVDITISASISPVNSNLSSYDNFNDDSICTDNESEHLVRIKEIYGENMCVNDMQFVETLYKMPQMNVNKTFIDIESHNVEESEIRNLNFRNSPIIESPNPRNSPVPSELRWNNDDIIKSEYVENGNIESLENITDKNAYKCPISNEKTKEPEKLTNESILFALSDCQSSASSSPEVSSTTSEEKSSNILLKITSVNGSRRSEINNVSPNPQQLRYKYTEHNDYTSNYRPLITKAAQKYIPPIIESHDLKVKLPLPQNSLNKLKQLKLAKKEEAFISTISKYKREPPRQDIIKKVKPKFEDVLKSIDEIQFKMHKNKCKKTKHSIPKVVIKKNENGAHYASTPIKKDSFNPDLTGRKWQPWVFIERNEFVDRMVQRNKHRAVYCHRKKTFVLEEKIKKYKSVCTAKFVISQPTSDSPSSGNLKYTIKLKHNC